MKASEIFEGENSSLRKAYDEAVMKLPRLKCKRCDYQWIPRSEKLPQNCAGCNSPYWNKKRRNEKV